MFISACSENSDQAKSETDTTKQENKISITASSSNEQKTQPATPDKKIINYDFLQKNILYGRATLADARKVLTQRDIGALTNSIHALYNMRWHRGVYHLIYDLWNVKKEKYPELAWDLIQEAPVRIALASTINRIQIINTDEYLEYIRAHKEDDHEFHRAQVVVALGFNGESGDIEYIKSMVNGDNHYVAQSAISALALMDSNQARDAMAELWKEYRGTKKGILIKTLLKKAYKVEPTLTPPEPKQ
jgi:hypothetical protein